MAAAKKTAAKAVKTAAKKAPAKKAPAKKVVSGKVTVAASAGKKAPSHQEIADLAHHYWKERGHHHGSHEQDWVRAEKELRGK
jgi:hypothetical protein